METEKDASTERDRHWISYHLDLLRFDHREHLDGIIIYGIKNFCQHLTVIYGGTSKQAESKLVMYIAMVSESH